LKDWLSVQSQNNFESLETQMRKSAVVQERAGLVAVHMYKQFLDFQQSAQNTNEMFAKITENLQAVAEYLRQSFSVRNIPSQNVSFEIDQSQTLALVNVLWHTISFTSRFNVAPKALPRGESALPLFCGRIFAVNGNYHQLVQGVEDLEGQVKIMLDNEIASLYIPADKNQGAIITIRHKENQEFLVSQVDASREFLLKVIEIVCAGGQFHEQGVKKL
jgi:hypothetical protein